MFYKRRNINFVCFIIIFYPFIILHQELKNSPNFQGTLSVNTVSQTEFVPVLTLHTV